MDKEAKIGMYICPACGSGVASGTPHFCVEMREATRKELAKRLPVKPQPVELPLSLAERTSGTRKTAQPDQSRLLTDAEIESAVWVEGNQILEFDDLVKVAKAQLAKDEARIEALIVEIEQNSGVIMVIHNWHNDWWQELKARYTNKEKKDGE